MTDLRCHRRDAICQSAAHEVALECLLAGIRAAQPSARVAETLSVNDGTLTVETDEVSEYDLEAYDDVVVLGGGNAAAQFASALEDELGEWLTGGVVVTDDPAETSIVNVHAGDHPIPSDDGVAGTERVLKAADACGEDDLVLATITGGGSALLAAPAPGLALLDLQAVTNELLACGATIDEINAVRKHCSAIKGGHLARAVAPASLVTLVLSDVVGDNLSVIASGPTVPDDSTYRDALGVLERYDLSVPQAVWDHLEAGANDERPETPTATDPVFDRTHTHVLGNGRTALEAARESALEAGYEPLILASGVRGEAREAALTHVAIAEECRKTGLPVTPPAVLLSGGETTVTLGDDPGAGGPNQEFVLSGALALEDEEIVVSSVDTDGIDGATDVAGAIADGSTIPEQAGRDALERNDALSVLEEASAVIRTGPSGTNVNDLRAIVVEPSE
ncbi:DUF4147 domain-containing protein [Natronolimnobius sp. AArcel1]|uniref:glycerate kinase type-2 family protein n=1 Tax=Natronolimnobius sp. AArcel1 TaxID=1679093 RepID=UPI0013ECB6F8|nr:DUF4147 domain-containing protein [Natronolimnobius sp. AArcel1]NGM67966.1 DUF4147 domain-containing protein [Natronolimnobius sp. AArcel1]